MIAALALVGLVTLLEPDDRGVGREWVAHEVVSERQSALLRLHYGAVSNASFEHEGHVFASIEDGNVRGAQVYPLTKNSPPVVRHHVIGFEAAALNELLVGDANASVQDNQRFNILRGSEPPVVNVHLNPKRVGTGARGLSSVTSQARTGLDLHNPKIRPHLINASLSGGLNSEPGKVGGISRFPKGFLGPIERAPNQPKTAHRDDDAGGSSYDHGPSGVGHVLLGLQVVLVALASVVAVVAGMLLAGKGDELPPRRASFAYVVGGLGCSLAGAGIGGWLITNILRYGSIWP